jgi:predicted phosphodiesterase
VSKRFTLTRKKGGSTAEAVDLDELFASIKRHKARRTRAEGEHGFIIALGDMQFGKIDGDGVEGTLARTIDYLDKAADLVETYRKRFDIGHVHVAWLGDHIEGFVSQGGANTWRTPLSLNEQIRLTRRVMLHALHNVADLAQRVSMVAVPGNHGEPQRFAGKGVTRYDDSHDTESLIAVADAAELNANAFGHVEFYVPATDELTVVTEVAGTVVAHAHGHQWKPGKHFDWWKGQAFNRESSLYQADLLLAGHLHHEHVDSDGKRLFIQPPAMESESTWWRHATGTTGYPGLVVAITKDGVTSPLEVVR